MYAEQIARTHRAELRRQADAYRLARAVKAARRRSKAPGPRSQWVQAA